MVFLEAYEILTYDKKPGWSYAFYVSYDGPMSPMVLIPPNNRRCRDP